MPQSITSMAGIEEQEANDRGSTTHRIRAASAVAYTVYTTAAAKRRCWNDLISASPDAYVPRKERSTRRAQPVRFLKVTE